MSCKTNMVSGSCFLTGPILTTKALSISIIVTTKVILGFYLFFSLLLHNPFFFRRTNTAKTHIKNCSISCVEKTRQKGCVSLSTRAKT